MYGGYDYQTFDNYDYIVKTIIVGDNAVGKTSIVENLVENTFSPYIDTSIGVDYRVKIIELANKKVKFQLWDTAGQEKFRSITKTYYRSAELVLIVFDVSRYPNFSKLQNWIEEVRFLNQTCQIFLIGNKIDLNRNVSFDQARKFADDNNISYYECSAKDSTNIEESFQAIAANLYEQNLLRPIQRNQSVNLQEKERTYCYKCF